MHRGKNHLTRTRDVESYDYSLCLMSRLEEEDLDYETEKKIRKKLAELDKNDGSESLVKKDLEVPEVPEDFEQSLQQTQQLLVNSRKRKMDQRDQVPVRKTVKSRLLRRVEDLDVTEESSPMEVAQDITVKLHEEKMDLILRVVEILGKEIAIQLFHETQETENDEGILVAVSCHFEFSIHDDCKRNYFIFSLRMDLDEGPLVVSFFTYCAIMMSFQWKRFVKYSVKRRKLKKNSRKHCEPKGGRTRQKS